MASSNATYPTDEPARLNRIAASLKGTRIAHVTYWGLQEKLLLPGVHHNLSHVEVILNDGRTLHVGWYALEVADEGDVDKYYLAVDLRERANEEPTRLIRQDGIEVNQREPWSWLMDSTITEATMFWGVSRHRIPAGPKPPDNTDQEALLRWRLGPQTWSEPIYYPQDLELQFANGPIIIFVSGAQMENSDHFYHGEPPVNVVFSDEIAERLTVGRYSQ